MDIRTWEQRAAEQDGLAYGEDYGHGYLEDEGYYEDAGHGLPLAEYEELVFQRTLDKIRYARATGEADVSLTPEELDVYQNRLWRQRAPAARPPARARPFSAPVVHSHTGAPAATTSSNISTQGSSSPRKKDKRRSSIFGGKGKKEKSGNRARATSNATESSIQQAPPGFRVPGPNGQTMFTPINGYQEYVGRDTRSAQPGSPLRPASRHSSHGQERHVPTGGNKAGDPRAPRQAKTPPRIATSRDIPGAFPSSPVSLRMPTPPQTARPGSSSSRISTQDYADMQGSSGGRSRSSTIQQPPNLALFPVTEYKHHKAEPFQYQSAGQLAQSPTQPQYARRVGSAESHTSVPRRVPVPVQHAGMQGIQGSYSDPAISHAEPTTEMREDDGPGIEAAHDSRSTAPSGKSAEKQGSGGKDGERRRKGGRSRRKTSR
ncbi:hypothetical protein BU23DRAFT_581615 [Bimuria novae-zelandiae CBS 107.79]|uniref:Uncharacterized protein n=1 Tax=Bimuria novae-zelandiae CBS 107.79 TaxID=1447943 RepID=A0A6A5V229_9PLEO|nr:hypothetical protein BU23DRAFT_581615 [Bimuria novae-zelandiae CBS 107.79]